jgi:exopolysaccharide biosynthesis polyprenyl glycosylphosphotransferase
MKERSWVQLFLVSDWVTAVVSWFLFFCLRKEWVEGENFVWERKVFLGLLIIPVFWILLYFLQGTYHDIRRMYRVKSLALTLNATIIGTIVLFFVLLIDDNVNTYQDYYQSIILLFGLHFSCTASLRILLASFLVHHISQLGNGFPTLVIGGNEKAVEIVQELKLLPKNTFDFVGYLNINGSDFQLSEHLPNLGNMEVLEKIITKHKVEEVIIALDSSEHDRLRKIVSRIDDGHLRIKVLPDMYVLLSGYVRLTNIYGALLTEIVTDVMPFWQQQLKRMMDFVLSFIAVILLLPLYIFSAIAVRISSKGPIFYLQERIGLNGKPFKIIKFRTMYVNSEAAGPQLSSENDPRITPIGRFMRKTRLDEFPQFINVLLGHMSLVGPRPERQFYIDQIVKIEPQYLHLTRVRPGITSWGQVKFGYAENVEQMLQRMKFDLLYLKNRSIALDLKIMFYTVIIVFKAKGK